MRSTRILLKKISGESGARVRERFLEEASDEADRYDVASSNTVVMSLGDRFETVERPSEGSLWEALQRLSNPQSRVIYVARGAGEGDFLRSDDAGYSGLAAALQTEGYVVRDLVTPAMKEVPEDAAALLLVSPRRPLRAESLDAIRRYLDRGGALVAFLEPGVHSGIERLLEERGFALPDGVIIDPASGPVEGAPPGVNPIAYTYDPDHPVVRNLGPNKMTFFLTARPAHAARKPRPDDVLRDFVYSSPTAWVSQEIATVEGGRLPDRSNGASRGSTPIAASGRYPRESGEARIIVFGDSDFATNHYLRSLYNLDVVLNAVHWAAERDGALTERPKAWTPDQYPLPPQKSLQMFYSLGLLLPELLLIAGAITWLRHRTG